MTINDDLRVLAPLLAVSVLISISLGIIILWPRAQSLEHHVSLNVSDVQYNGTQLELTIHFVMPQNESLICFGFRDDPNGNLTRFSEATFMDGDSLRLTDPNQLGLPRECL